MTVTGGSALGRDDIDRMVRDAEAHADEDRKRRESVELRNQADTFAFSTEKTMKENADKIPGEVKTPVEEALAKLKEALKGTGNDDEVKAALDDLNAKASAMGQAMYAAAQAGQQAASAPGASGSHASGGSDDDVVEAEIVDDDKDTK